MIMWGYKAAQVKDIVDEIGLPRIVYYYFKSKEGVMETVLKIM